MTALSARLSAFTHLSAAQRLATLGASRQWRKAHGKPPPLRLRHVPLIVGGAAILAVLPPLITALVAAAAAGVVAAGMASLCWHGIMLRSADGVVIRVRDLGDRYELDNFARPGYRDADADEASSRHSVEFAAAVGTALRDKPIVVLAGNARLADRYGQVYGFTLSSRRHLSWSTRFLGWPHAKAMMRPTARD